MYKFLRDTHLFLGLFLFLFILTYGVSSAIFAYPGWVSSTPTITEQDVDVGLEMGFDVPDLCWDVYNIEAEALGQKVVFFEDNIPALDNALDALSKQIEASPDDADLIAQRAALFEQVGLEKLN